MGSYLAHGKLQKEQESQLLASSDNTGYGVLSHINFPLEQPSDLEVMLMSTVRLYHMVTKVSSRDGKLGRGIPKGDLIYLPHDGPEEILKFAGTI